MLSAIWLRRFQYAFIAIIVTTVGFSLYQWNASRASTQKTAPNNGLVGYWSFDEGTGTQAGDASGNGNTGILTNGPTWTTGKLGQAINFDGVDDTVTIGSGASLSTSVFTYAAWINPSGNGTTRTIKGNSGAGAPQFRIETNNTLGLIQQSSNNIGFSSGVITNGIWNHVAVTYDVSGNYKFYINGIISGSGTSLQSLSFNTSILGVGNAGGEKFSGVMDEVRIYNRALSGTEVTNLYNLGAEKLNVSPVSNLTSGLVGYWTFDGKDTPWSSSSAGTATDRSGNANTGTLTNMSRATTPTIGKLGQALNFDGVNDRISTTTDVIGTGATSTCAWTYPRSTGGGGFGRIVLSQDGGGTEKTIFLMQSGPRIGLSSNGGGTSLNTANTITYNQWIHVCATRDASGNGLIYVNGILENSGPTGTPSSGGTTVQIGDRSLGGRTFDGLIDDVRIYNRQISATEVQSLYDLGASDKVNSSVSQSQGTGRLDSGLVGYWKLDDASGTTATDSSTNANNGTLTSGPTWTTGKIGSAVDFTGTKYITIPNSTPLRVTGDMTVSFWIYLRGYGAGGWNPIINKFSTDISNEFNIRYQTSSTGQFYSGGSGAINAFLTWDPSADAGLNNWVHVVARRNITAGTMDMWFNGIKKRSASASGLTDATTQPLQFGGGPNGGAGGVDFNGLLDEVRVYNRAISDDEIAQLYRLNRPSGADTSLKGYWSFNGQDISGTTAYDRSGAGNNGTLTNGPTPAIGKLGQALSFDGVDDYATTPDSDTLDVLDSTNFSLSGWFSRNTFTTDDTIIAKSNGQASSDTGYNAYIDDTTDKLTFVANDGTDQYKIESVSTFTATGWHHFTLVWDDASSANTKLYIDGTSEAATTTGTFANVNSLANALTFRIGAESDNGNPFDGKIDEVRVYNRALSSTEVSALYNVGR